MLTSQRVDLILDVGANIGQYGRELRSHVGYRGRIVSFEPMRRAHATLTRVASRDGLWDVASRAAIGAENGSTTINVAANSQSSSLLPMLDAHASAFPESRYTETESVPIRRLDSIAREYLLGKPVPFLKIDTQGYEREVLMGATETLQRVVGVQLELSLVALYDGQALMPELMDFVKAAGFDLWGISPTTADPKTGRMLQVDATFFRRTPSLGES
jgi:FkbM family methyltransferase